MIQKLYLLRPYRTAWYDQTEAAVIRARSSNKARKMAQEAFGWENRHTIGSKVDWLNPRDVKLTKIGEATPGTRQTEEVVLESNRGS